MAILTLTKDSAKTKVTYKIVTSICETHGAEKMIVYGVTVKRAGEFNDYARIEDISTNKREVEQLILRLIKGNVTPDQLVYVVEDYLVELST